MTPESPLTGVSEFTKSSRLTVVNRGPARAQLEQTAFLLTRKQKGQHQPGHVKALKAGFALVGGLTPNPSSNHGLRYQETNLLDLIETNVLFYQPSRHSHVHFRLFTNYFIGQFRDKCHSSR